MTHRKVQGFTLMELVILMGIISILASFAIPKFSSTDQVGVYIQAQQILSDIRLAQGLSIATGTRYRWQALNSSSYSVINSAGTAIPLASGGTIMSLANGITMTMTNLPNSVIVFDRVGTPYVDTLLPGTALAANALITLTHAGTNTVSITPATGYGVIQ